MKFFYCNSHFQRYEKFSMLFLFSGIWKTLLQLPFFTYTYQSSLKLPRFGCFGLSNEESASPSGGISPHSEDREFTISWTLVLNCIRGHVNAVGVVGVVNS